ncbi:HNH endonuclease [Streptomyces sp. NPDC002758]
MSSYRDVQSAARVEKFRIWFAWLSGNIIMLLIAGGTRNINVVSTITQILFTASFFLLTFVAIRMTNALDHEVPLSKGGSLLDPANARAAHRRCNSARGNRLTTPQARASRRWWPCSASHARPRGRRAGTSTASPPR